MIYFAKGAMAKTVTGGRTLVDKWKPFGGDIAEFTGDDRPELIEDTEFKVCVEKGITNLFLNSDTLATQDVTVTAVAHTVAIEGTGSIEFSGAHTGTLNGVEGERVSVTFTPTAGTLTCTVSGTVTRAQIETGSYPTLYVQSTGTQGTRPAPSLVVDDALPSEGTVSGVMNLVRDPVSSIGIPFILYENTTVASGRYVLAIYFNPSAPFLLGDIAVRVGNESLLGNAAGLLPSANERFSLAYAKTYNSAGDVVLMILKSNGELQKVINGTTTYAVPTPTSVAVGGRSDGTRQASTHIENMQWNDPTVRTGYTDQEWKEYFERITFGTSMQMKASDMTIVP